MENDLPSATNMRLLALTAAVASILKHLPAARAELEEIAMALDDSPPVAVSDAMLENFSQEILDVIAGRWK